MLTAERYAIDFASVLGSGAFGTVYKATDTAAEPPTAVACKVVKGNSLSEKARRQLMQEVELHGAISHPNVIKCFGAWNDVAKQNVCIFVELAAGDLGALLLEETQSLSRLAIKFMHDLLSAVTHLHEQSIMHSDIKPTNLLLHFDGRLQLCDLGAAARVESRGGRTTLVGSPAYHAPEVVAIGHLGLEPGGATYSYPADIWSAGVVLVEMLSGSLPFQATPRDAVAQPERICFRPPTLSPASAFSTASRSLVLRLLTRMISSTNSS